MNGDTPIPAAAAEGQYRCPSCSSANVRPSRRGTRFRWFYYLRGLQKYRCRECRKSFFVEVSTAAKRAFQRDEDLRRKRRRGWRNFVQGSAERRTMELLLFLAMLLVFYAVLNALLKRDGL